MSYSKRIQFFHRIAKNQFFKKHAPEFTAVCDVPTEENLRNLLKMRLDHKEAMISIPFGITHVHAKDQYNRKIGRTKALENCKGRFFRLTEINFNDKITEYILESNGIRIILETKEGRKTPYFTAINFYE